MKSFVKPSVLLIFKISVFLILLTASIGCSTQNLSTETSSTTEQMTITSPITSPVSTTLTTLITTSYSTITVTSVPVILTSITIEPIKTEVLNSGATQQFNASGHYSDGTIKDITTQVYWRSSDETVVATSSTGEVSNVAKISLSDPLLPTGISLTANVAITAAFAGINSNPVNLTVKKAPLKPLPPLDAFMKGIYFNDWALFEYSQLPTNTPLSAPPPPLLLKTGLYTPPKADQNLINLSFTGANWIAVSVRWGQETISSTKISRSDSATATDAQLRRVIDLAHSLGIRVLLMPLLHLSNDPTHGHIYIASTFSSETQWQEWFTSYGEFINYYASFSQGAGVDMLFIGNELGATTHREDDWRRVISGVRERFKGPITYDSLCSGPFPGSEYSRIKWWDAVDYIGVGGYFPLTNKNNPTVEELKAAWIDKGYLAELEALSNIFNKPIIISEIGYESKDGANKIPGYFQLDAPLDLQEQADCYRAAFEVLWGKPWFKGIFWFQWFSNPRPVETGGLNDTSCNPYGKPAEEVLKEYYLSK